MVSTHWTADDGSLGFSSWSDAVVIRSKSMSERPKPLEHDTVNHDAYRHWDQDWVYDSIYWSLVAYACPLRARASKASASLWLGLRSSSSVSVRATLRKAADASVSATSTYLVMNTLSGGNGSFARMLSPGLRCRRWLVSEEHRPCKKSSVSCKGLASLPPPATSRSGFALATSSRCRRRRSGRCFALQGGLRRSRRRAHSSWPSSTASSKPSTACPGIRIWTCCAPEPQSPRTAHLKMVF